MSHVHLEHRRFRAGVRVLQGVMDVARVRAEIPRAGQEVGSLDAARRGAALFLIGHPSDGGPAPGEAPRWSPCSRRTGTPSTGAIARLSGGARCEGSRASDRSTTRTDQAPISAIPTATNLRVLPPLRSTRVGARYGRSAPTAPSSRESALRGATRRPRTDARCRRRTCHWLVAGTRRPRTAPREDDMGTDPDGAKRRTPEPSASCARAIWSTIPKSRA